MKEHRKQRHKNRLSGPTGFSFLKVNIVSLKIERRISSVTSKVGATSCSKTICF